MTVSTPIQPNVTTQSAAIYKAAIDAQTAALAQTANMYAPHEASTPNMTVKVDAGRFLTSATSLVTNAQQTTATITAPVTNPRIDRVVIDAVTGVVSVITGVEAVSPTAPAITSGKLPICQVALATSTTAITNSLITDERAFMANIPTLLESANVWSSEQTFSSAVNLTSGQITFPATQNPSAGANTLDDYEEGTWTPSVGGTATYTSQTGSYTKIGRVVHFLCKLDINVIGTGSTTTISGLPFAAAGSGIAGVCPVIWSTTTATYVTVIGQLSGGASTITFNAATAATAILGGGATLMGNGTALYLSGSYIV